MHTLSIELEKKLWSAADELRANSELKSSEYSVPDARGSEMEIRRQLIQSGVVDVMVSIGSNFFSNVTLPCTLWFFDKSKANPPKSPFLEGGLGGICL